jgi:hypothetical protein
MKLGLVETLIVEVHNAGPRAVTQALIEIFCDDDDFVDEHKVEKFLGFLRRAVDENETRKKARS